LLTAGLPEIDLVKLIQPGQLIEPVTIRYSDEEAHALPSTADQRGQVILSSMIWI
jgi:hypothetical protein